jgi:CubicO group peptidase (beta-lactamase class C family)
MKRMHRPVPPVRSLYALVLLLGSTASYADVSLQSYVQSALLWLQNRDHNPAISGLIQIDGQVAAEAAVGVRALGHPEAVTIDDRWHIGSCTKAFTATLLGVLADRHELTLDDTLETSLPALAKTMNRAYRHVTIRQLLSHTAGLPQLKNLEEFPAARDAVGTVQGERAQHMALARYYLMKPPAYAAGTFHYSNLGYILAGAIAETRTGKPWEILLRERVFDPLGISHVGFGPPGRSGEYDQPLGHGTESGREPLDPADPEHDNPAWIGPARIVNISLRDWGRFAQDQLDGALGHGKLLQPSTYRTLQTPVVENYALGWGASLNPDGSVKALSHEGSNGVWFAGIAIYPERRTIILVATNFGGDVAQKSVEDFIVGMEKHLKLTK